MKTLRHPSRSTRELGPIPESGPERLRYRAERLARELDDIEGIHPDCARTVRKLVEAWDAALASQDQTWQPIETAPKDGTRIVIWTADDMAVHALWSDDERRWLDWDECVGVYEPRLWIATPRPAPSEVTHG